MWKSDKQAENSCVTLRQLPSLESVECCAREGAFTCFRAVSFTQHMLISVLYMSGMGATKTRRCTHLPGSSGLCQAAQESTGKWVQRGLRQDLQEAQTLRRRRWHGRKGIRGRGHCTCEDSEAWKTDCDWHRGEAKPRRGVDRVGMISADPIPSWGFLSSPGA